MATYLASIYGTEQDRVNCSFHQKIGACRHGTRCGRKHIRPLFSPTVLISNAYRNPRYAATYPHGGPASGKELQDRFDQFYADWYVELSKYGRLLELHVCDNVEDHLLGNLYARFEWEDEAQRALEAINGRWYDGRPVFAELSPVTDFREACCRSYEMVERQLRHEAAGETYERQRETEQLDRALRTASSTATKVEGEPRTPAHAGWKERIEHLYGPREVETDQPFAPLPEDALWRQGPSGGDWRAPVPPAPLAGDASAPAAPPAPVLANVAPVA